MTENDFIPRKAIYDAVNAIGGCDATEEWAKGYDSAIDAVMDILEGMPAADVEPVRHGHWIGYEYDASRYYRCSQCYKGNVAKRNYCPNCGAKMDGEH
ncbi:MAG: hypothetical protein ACI4RG_08565 [Huintestinicola sp.]